MRNSIFAALLALLIGWTSPLLAADLDKPLILVAKPELSDALYSSTVLVAAPISDGQHVGFIVNRPTDVTLGKVFPDHAPSQKINDPIYLGGPVDAQTIFALVPGPGSPGGASVEIMPGLFAVLDAATIDRIIEHDASGARFLAGIVVWRQGELESEIGKGAWFVHDADAALVMRKPEGLWEELVRRSPVSGPAGQPRRAT